MKIFAISDLHLSFGVQNKNMDLFGEQWFEHYNKIRDDWFQKVDYCDVVLIPGDISWASSIDEAMPDLDWIDQLPGTKIILKGNHDYWWQSLSKLNASLPDSIIPIHNNSIVLGEYLFFGTRLWEYERVNIDLLRTEFPDKEQKVLENKKILKRELQRLRISIESFPESHHELIKIGMSHFPPCSSSMEKTEALECFSSAGARNLVFGHLHGVPNEESTFSSYKNTQLHLTSCDFLNFKLKRII